LINVVHHLGYAYVVCQRLFGPTSVRACLCFVCFYCCQCLWMFVFYFNSAERLINLYIYY